MFDEIREILADHGYTEWQVVDDCVLICPCGHSIEWDGRCPDGCVSPMLRLGLV